MLNGHDHRGSKPLPGPISPIPGVRYVCTRQPDLPHRWVLTWYASGDEWRKILNLVRALPDRCFDPLTKRWNVPARPEIGAWLATCGWTLPSSQESVTPVPSQKKHNRASVVVPAAPPKPKGPTPEEKQREQLAQVQLESFRPLVQGLRPYQVDFIRFMTLRKGRGALGDDMGTGKTVQALAWLAYSGMFPALIVVNASTKFQWREAFHRWLDGCPGLNPAFRRVGILSGRTPYMLEPGVSCIVNWDILADWAGGLTNSGQFVLSGPLSRMGFQLLIGDEIQAIGNPKSNRAKAFRALAKQIPGVIGMSGTPARSKPAQFWSLLNILEPAQFPNQLRYLQRYCGPKGNGFGITYNGASHIEELHEKLVPCMLRRTKAQVMKDLPPKIMEVVPLEVDDQEMKNYQMREAEAFNDAGATALVLREKVAALLRTAFGLKEKSCISWVRDFLDNGENKLLIFAWHRDVVDLLVEELKAYHPGKLYGGISPKDREGCRQRFIKDSNCRVLVANIQAGGVGIDGFQEVCSHCAFVEFSHTPNDHRQAEDRLHRGGQKRAVNSYYLVAPGTVDMDAVEVLDSRAKMLDGVLDGKAPADIDLLGEILARRGIGMNPKEKGTSV